MTDSTKKENEKEDTQNEGHPPISSFGEPQERQYSPLASTAAIMMVYFMYLTSSMLPVLLIIFLIGIYYGYVSSYFLAILSSLVALDFAVPLQNGYHPDPQQKTRLERLFAEGTHHYFPGKSIFLPNSDKDISDRKAYILAAWPHGLMGGGGHVGFAEFSQRGIYPIYTGASVLRFVPFVRRFLHALGFCDVSKPSLEKVLNVQKYGPSYPNNVVHLIVGGIQEMFYSPLGSKHEQIILARRKGFIKLALQTQADIIPMYTFGANQMYGRLFGNKSILCQVSSSLQMSLVIWLGRWGIPMGWIPYQTPLLGVIGHVLEVPKVEPDKITDELVQQVHADFCKVLKQLFDDYKKVYVEEMGADPSWLTKELKLENEN